MSDAGPLSTLRLPTHIYASGNNPCRKFLRGRGCVIEATGGMGTCLIRMVDTGERVATSRRALRRVAC